ncbi:MAG: DNA-3-methyladenine glycosylase [Candidatus Lokiarchaeota archaeon]|nr:DNA-3-methyladenine glycosylase [Candidatus Lokiarchaeota archaeon]
MENNSKLERLKQTFFNRNTKKVAKDLIGRYLIRETEHGNMIGKITEVEAYVGPDDKACHCYNYRKTDRTKIMYRTPGTHYVYLIYGMYHCLNVVTEEEGMPCAVLIRELYPVAGIEIMKSNRNVKIGKKYKNLVDGPGKLCMALDITKEKFNGKNSCSLDAKLYYTKGEPVEKASIEALKRIGIDYAGKDKERLLRFRVEG